MRKRFAYRQLARVSFWLCLCYGSIPSCQAAQLPAVAAADPDEITEPSSWGESRDDKQEPSAPFSILEACWDIVEQDKEALAWTETWEAWHYFTITAYGGTPILGILASYLEEQLAFDDLQLNEWMRYWYVCTHMPAACQSSLTAPEVWAWLEAEQQLTKKLVNDHPAATKLLAERVRQLPAFKEKLFALIEQSKQDPTQAVAAANAMTILNAANVSFSGQDLNGIHVAVKVRKRSLTLFGTPFSPQSEKGDWQGPNLMGAMLSGTDLRNADLRGAQLGKACLNQAHMGGAQLEQASFGFPHDNTLRTGDGCIEKRSAAQQLPDHPLRLPQGHTASVYSVCFSPDGSLLASASSDTTLRVWDAVSGTCLRMCLGHKAAIRSVGFAPDGRTLASASDDHTLRLWDAASATYLCKLKGHTESVWGTSFAPDGRTLASASSDHTLRLWDTTTGACLRELGGHTDSVYSVCFSPDSRTLASASSDNTLRVWDPRCGTCLRMLKGHTDSVWGVSFSPDCTTLASASSDHTLRLWDAASGRCLRTLQRHTAPVWSVSFSPDCATLASASDDNTLRLWHTVSGTCLRTLEGHAASARSMSFSPDCATLASASDDNTLRIWDASTGNVLYILGDESSLALDAQGLDIQGAQGLSKADREALVSCGAQDSAPKALIPCPFL